MKRKKEIILLLGYYFFIIERYDLKEEYILNKRLLILFGKNKIGICFVVNNFRCEIVCF